MGDVKTREEHIEFCKVRAREYLDRGQIADGITSMMSDLNKHEDTRSAGESMAMLAMLCMTQNDMAEARRFVEGFR